METLRQRKNAKIQTIDHKALNGKLVNRIPTKQTFETICFFDTSPVLIFNLILLSIYNELIRLQNVFLRV